MRLTYTLANHFRKMGITKTKKEREQFVLKILQDQKFTCLFAGGDDRFCWNHPRKKDLKYLRLEWGHKTPSHYGEKSRTEDNLILLCARCNNQLQSSRTVIQLIPELEHKLGVLKRIISSY